MRSLLAVTRHPNGQVIHYWRVGPGHMAQEWKGLQVAYQLPLSWLPGLLADIRALGGSVVTSVQERKGG